MIRGTRFPVSSIVWNPKLGLTVEEILREFPHLSLAQIHEAPSYYYDHQTEIEEKIHQAQSLDTWMKQYATTLKVKRDCSLSLSR